MLMKFVTTMKREIHKDHRRKIIEINSKITKKLEFLMKMVYGISP
jgi:hypothetical protein